MLEKIAEIYEEVADIDKDLVTEEASLIDDLELSSVEILQTTGKIEAAFNVVFKDDEIDNFETVGDVMKAIAKGLGR